MSTSPSSTTPAQLSAAIRPKPLVAHQFGEPRFYCDGDVAALAFRADGSLYSVDEAGVLRHWSVDGRLLRRAYLSDLETLWAFSPQGERLASASNELLFWDVESGILTGRLPQASWVTALGFSADARLLATGHDDGTVRFWDASTREHTGEIKAHSGPISALAFDPQSSRIATADEDRIVRVWDLQNKAVLHELHSHTDRIPSLVWRADGALLISAGWDTSARVWDLNQPDPIMLLNSHSDQVLMLAAHPSGSLLASADSDFEIRLWSDPSTGTVSHVLRGHVDEIRCMAFSPDGTKLASAGADRVIFLWDVETGTLLAGPSPVARHSIAVIARGADLQLASTGDAKFRIWDVKTGSELPLTGTEKASCVSASPDGRWLAVGGVDCITRLYDLNTPELACQQLEATKPPIGALAFHAASNLIAQTSPTDGLVWLWKPGEPEANLILIEAGDGCTLESIAFLPNRNQLAVGGIDCLSTGERTGAVCVWDLNTKKKAIVFDVGVYSLAVDPTGRYLAGAGISDALSIWDLSTEELVFELHGHQSRIHAVAFSPDGSYLVSSSDDLTLRVWDVLSGRLLMVREFDHPIQSLAFSPDGSWLFTGNSDTTCYQIDFARFMEE